MGGSSSLTRVQSFVSFAILGQRRFYACSFERDGMVVMCQSCDPGLEAKTVVVGGRSLDMATAVWVIRCTCVGRRVRRSCSRSARGANIFVGNIAPAPAVSRVAL